MSRTLGEAVSETARMLSVGNIPDSLRDARALVAAATGVPRDRIMLEAAQHLDTDARERLDAYVAARLARQPVSQIIGERLFWGRSFRVTGAVLDPRPETETLVACALTGAAPQTLLDLGTGSGILAVTLALEFPAVSVLATDTSEAALSVARENAEAFGVENRIEFRLSDWWAVVEGRFDMVVSNPPYIPQTAIADLSPEVRDWEPHQALAAGPDGLEAYRAIAAGLADGLAANGKALMEFGIGQAAAVADIFKKTDLFEVDIANDMDNRPRIAQITRKP